MVAGTGHDFLNRHSCENGVFIRTALLKNISWDLADSRGLGNADGNVKLGSGLVWDEVQKSASLNNRFVVTGWSPTVGVVGWSIGGGHGFMAPGYGLGVDNILEADIVLHDGTLLTVNSNNNSDLYWAIRGGGGSNWGIITSITVKAHKIPTGGITLWAGIWNGNFCNNNSQLNSFIDGYHAWVLNQTNLMGGLMFFTPTFTNKTADCLATWSVMTEYFYQGPSTDAYFKNSIANLTAVLKPNITNTTGYATPWSFVQTLAAEYLIPVNMMAPTSQFVGGIPSVFVSRDVVASG